MKITVKFFAYCRDLAKTDEIQLEIVDGSTGGDLWKILQEKFPALKKAASSTLLAVNMEYVEPSLRLEDGDEVALIPPVSGG